MSKTLNPRTILLALLCAFCWAALVWRYKNQTISAASRKDADAIGHVETERDVSILRGGSSHGSNGRAKAQGTLVAPTQADVAHGPLNPILAELTEELGPDEAQAVFKRVTEAARIERTTRPAFPGVRKNAPDTNLFPLFTP